VENVFSKYLLENGWRKINLMTFQNIKKPEYEIFFDSSNQIELYIDNERKDERYLFDEIELINFLELNNCLV
jgi:hypothetical protein